VATDTRARLVDGRLGRARVVVGHLVDQVSFDPSRNVLCEPLGRERDVDQGDAVPGASERRADFDREASGPGTARRAGESRYRLFVGHGRRYRLSAQKCTG
jgi:hypothetical protein